MRHQSKDSAIAAAKKWARGQQRTLCVVEADYEEGRAWFIAAEDYVGCDEYEAFDSILVCTVASDGTVSEP